MDSNAIDRVVADYMARLERALAPIAAPRRAQIVIDISEHIAEARTELPDDPTELAVRQMLERVGRPDAIAADALEVEPPAPVKVSTLRETFAVLLLLLGGVVLPFAGWFIGLYLLWTSEAWDLRDKLIGTLILPGGLLAALWYAFTPVAGGGSCSAPGSVTHTLGTVASHCTTTSSGLPRVAAVVVIIALFVLPVVTAFYLNHRRHMGGASWFGRLHFRRAAGVTSA